MAVGIMGGTFATPEIDTGRSVDLIRTPSSMALGIMGARSGRWIENDRIDRGT